MTAVLRYATTTLLWALLVGTLPGLLAGRGPLAVLESVFGFLWTGWLVILLFAPLYPLLVWAVGRVQDVRPGLSVPVAATIGGASLGAIAALALLAIAFATPRPPGEALTIDGALGGLVVIGACGALYGAIDGALRVAGLTPGGRLDPSRRSVAS